MPTGKRGSQARNVPTQVKLVFDVDDDTVVSLLSDEAHSRSSSRRSGKRQGRQRAGRSVASAQAAQSNNQETTAKREAAKAVAIAQAAIKKYPPTFKTAHQGDYYSLPNCFGNPRPVVFFLMAGQSLSQKQLFSRAGNKLLAQMCAREFIIHLHHRRL